MGQGTGRRLLTAVLAVVSATVLAGCWAQPGFDGGRTYSSTLPTGITASTVASLRPAFRVDAGSEAAQPDVAVANGVLYVTGDRLLAVDATGSTGCTGAVPLCGTRWESVDSSFLLRGPTLAAGKVWVTSAGRLRAYDAAGEVGCGGVPKRCTAVIDVPVADEAGTPVAGTDGIYVTAATFANGGFTHAIVAFDHEGNRRWRAPLGGAPEPSYVAPVVADGTVFALIQGSPDRIAALDAAGTRSCGGVPRVCLPVWIINSGTSQLAVANGRLFSYGNHVEVYDARGVDGCVASVCAPRWQAGTSGHFAVTADTLVVAGQHGIAGYRFSACPVSLLLCVPSWVAPYPGDHPTPSGFTPTVAGGVVYASQQDGILAYSASGTVGCPAFPTPTCTPLAWFAFSYAPRAPVVVDGRAYVARPIGNVADGLRRDVTTLTLP